MKNLKSYYRLLVVLALVFTVFGCESDEEGDNIENDPSSSFEGSWKRENMETYVKFVGSNAITCSGGVETVGSFNASEPSMTFVIGEEVIKFPLKINGSALLVGVPNRLSKLTMLKSITDPMHSLVMEEVEVVKAILYFGSILI